MVSSYFPGLLLEDPNSIDQNIVLRGGLFDSRNVNRVRLLLKDSSTMTDKEVDLVFNSFRSTWLSNADLIDKIEQTKPF